MQALKTKDKKQPVLQTRAQKPAVGRQRVLKGVVVSDKMQKTVVVEVNWLKLDKKYKRRFRQTKRYSVHDPKEVFKTGDRVSIIECRPVSKKKRWRVRYEKVKG